MHALLPRHAHPRGRRELHHLRAQGAPCRCCCCCSVLGPCGDAQPRFRAAPSTPASPTAYATVLAGASARRRTSPTTAASVRDACVSSHCWKLSLTWALQWIAPTTAQATGSAAWSTRCHAAYAILGGSERHATPVRWRRCLRGTLPPLESHGCDARTLPTQRYAPTTALIPTGCATTGHATARPSTTRTTAP